MEFIRRYRRVIVGIGATAVVIGFLLFRPDKLFVDDPVDESLADAFAIQDTGADTSPAPTTSPASTTTEQRVNASTTTTTSPATTSVPSGPVVLAAGGFFGIDHSAAGTATVYELEGQRVLRFEDDTDIQNGPDLHVWLLAADEYDEESIPDDYLYLGTLKGNVGGQNYQLPDEFDPDLHRYVLIWCERFDVPFAAVPLA